jgi:hypothetical protein
MNASIQKIIKRFTLPSPEKIEICPGLNPSCVVATEEPDADPRQPAVGVSIDV